MSFRQLSDPGLRNISNTGERGLGGANCFLGSSAIGLGTPSRGCQLFPWVKSQLFLAGQNQTVGGGSGRLKNTWPCQNLPKLRFVQIFVHLEFFFLSRESVSGIGVQVQLTCLHNGARVCFCFLFFFSN